MTISEGLAESMSIAFVRAMEDKVEYVTIEHLLHGLLHDDHILRVLEACGVNTFDVATQLEEQFSLEEQPKSENGKEPTPTLGYQRVLQRVILLEQQVHRDIANTEITGEKVLLALLSETDSMACYILKSNGLTKETLLDHIEYGVVVNDLSSSNQEKMPDRMEKKNETPSAVESYTTNLNDLVRKGRIDPLIGRVEEVDRTIQILCRRRKNNPLLVGEAGVGKTAIAEGLAWKIENQQVPDVLKGYEVLSLDLGAMLAGTRYRGDFEERLKTLVDEFEQKPKSLLFLDEIHQLVGAGAQEGGAGDAATLLKPALARGSLKIIGATTYEEYRKILSKDTALLRRLQKIDVVEPSVRDTIDILRGLKDKFEAFHGVRFQEEALVAAAELSFRYITDRRLPDKAIDVIDEAGSFRRINSGDEKDNLIDKSDIEKVISRIARIPPQAVDADDRKRLKSLSTVIKNVVFGQDKAIDAIADSIKLARSGLGRAERPIGAFLFSGPTGVGKTEVARQLAFSMGIELIRFDMSEYMERHAVSRLIGAPPGYVGFDQGGLLTEAVNKKPYAVLLLDEIEKAHPDIYNILLQVMDHGSLTDNNGRQSDFRNVIIIMTTNAGAQALTKKSIGFVSPMGEAEEMADIKRLFSPEFRNRLDAIISFKPLGVDEIARVVDKFLLELEAQLSQKKVEVFFTKRTRQYLVQKGFDPLMGARPMSRLIQSTIRRALADELLFGKLAQGGKVTVDLDDDGKTHLTIEKKGRNRLASRGTKRAMNVLH